MAQSPKGGLEGPPYDKHLWVCAIYSETTVKADISKNCDALSLTILLIAQAWTQQHQLAGFPGHDAQPVLP